jgi:CheY-like chemotaxis protein
MMPALDGDALARLVKSKDLAPSVPILFYSSMDEEQLYRIAKQTPGSSYVLKSDGLPALYSAITNALGAKAGARSSERPPSSS